jgi:hypothetical protein
LQLQFLTFTTDQRSKYRILTAGFSPIKVSNNAPLRLKSFGKYFLNFCNLTRQKLAMNKYKISRDLEENCQQNLLFVT